MGNLQVGRGAMCALLLGAIMSLWTFDAAALRKVEPGEVPQLAPDEGVLVVSFDTDIPVDSARFEGKERGLSTGVMARLPAGRSVEVFVVPAGAYRWSRITFGEGRAGYLYIDLDKGREYTFQVKPGKLSYVGDFVFRVDADRRTSSHLVNRALPVIDWMLEKHPTLVSRYGFEYSGQFPDPFPDFYRAALAKGAKLPDDPNAGLSPPAPGELTLKPEEIWQASRVRDYALSPDGAFVVLELRDDDGDFGLDLVDIAAGSAQRLHTSGRPFGTVAWESDRTLLAGVVNDGGEALQVFRVGDALNGKRQVQHFRGPVGAIVDFTTERPNHILFQAWDHFGSLAVHDLALDSQADVSLFTTRKTRDRLNRGVTNDLRWYADGHGRLRAATAKSGENIVLHHGRDGSFREVHRFDAGDGFLPVALSFEGDLIYGLSDEGRPQRDLVVFDPAKGEIVETLHSVPGVDIVAPIFDGRRTPIGVTYYQSGRLVSRYFDEANQKLDTALQKSFPGKNAIPLRRSTDNRKMLVWVDASDMPPQLYYIDFDRKRADLVDDFHPRLVGKKMVPSRAILAKAADGTSIEAFVTVPAGEGKRPLVVLPHGGPIGVADRLHFDAEVQFIASLGYAVLQVNFRGSEGYGREFREAGHGQYGTGIEEDIDAALRQALAQFPLDGDRMCVLGTSYGGYSALVSAIRWPSRFRCAVSISGVSDRFLVFTSSDTARSEVGRNQMIKLMGDPRLQQKRFTDVSPLYQFHGLTVPVMLVHGRDDHRVDFEHARRLVRMLNLEGRPPVVLAFADEGHGLSGLKSTVIAWNGIAGFLRKHLEDRREPPAVDKVSPTPPGK